MKLFGNSKGSRAASGRSDRVKRPAVPVYEEETYAPYEEEAVSSYEEEEVAPVRTPAPAPGKAKKRHRGTLIAVCSVLVLMLGIWVFLSQYIRPPERPEPGLNLPSNVVQGDEQQEDDPAVNVDPNAEPTVDHSGEMKEDFYTVMLMGTDEEDYNADVIMVAGVDVKNKTVNVVSIPRDTMVNVSRSNKKINSSYGVGKSQTGQRADGAENLKDAVQSILGFRPDFYCQVSYNGFIDAVDAVGGIEFNVPQAIHKTDTAPEIHLEAGVQTLDGEHALMLMRYRGYWNADLGRIEMAQQFLTAAVGQILSPENLWNLPQLVSIAMENCSSDLDLGEMTWFGTQMINLNKENLNFYTIPVTDGMYRGGAYVYADEAGTLELVNQTVNPYTREITADDVDIICLKD